ncbi:MAG: sulfatase [Anaerolineae bacterium]|nr:sulfatase [Anaerolineae bacterium]
MSDSPQYQNAIWIFGDQHRAQALSCNGDPNLNTPNLDRLAAEGQNYARAVSGFPLCCPFRGSLLTSRYPHECVPGHEYPLPEGMPTVADVFNDYGFDTAYFGKWHLGGFQERNGRAAMFITDPNRRGGFDTWVGYDNNNSQWDSWVHGGEGETAFHYRLPGFETDCLTDMLVDYVRKQGEARRSGTGSPFFAVLSVQPPHNPYVAPADWMAAHTPAQVALRPNVPPVTWVEERARRELAGYYAQIENLDWNVGRVRQALVEAGLDGNTHIVFFSDHGDNHGSHGQFLKTSPWEESVRIPFIIGGLQGCYDGRQGRPDVLINHVDIAPTTLGLCGIDAPDWMRGHDYSGLRLASRPQRTSPDSAFIQSVVPTGHGDSVDRPWRAVVTRDRWKYVVLEGQPWLMFDLKEDPYELVNLAHNTNFLRERRRLQGRLAQWIADTGDEFALPEIA